MWQNLPSRRATPGFRYGVPRPFIMLARPRPPHTRVPPLRVRGVPPLRIRGALHSAYAGAIPSAQRIHPPHTPLETRPRVEVRSLRGDRPQRSEPGPGAWGDRRRNPARGKSRRRGGVASGRGFWWLSRRASGFGGSELPCPEVLFPRSSRLKRRCTAIVRADLRHPAYAGGMGPHSHAAASHRSQALPNTRGRHSASRAAGSPASRARQDRGPAPPVNASPTCGRAARHLRGRPAVHPRPCGPWPTACGLPTEAGRPAVSPQAAPQRLGGRRSRRSGWAAGGLVPQPPRATPRGGPQPLTPPPRTRCPGPAS